MHAREIRFLSLLVVCLLLFPWTSMPSTRAWEDGDEAAIFGHTFEEEYWTNSSIPIVTQAANASLTASYVHVEEFSAFLVAFNEIITNESTPKEVILPYQLFGMHYKTPEDQEVFIGAIFAFLMAHNESYGDNNIPDVGHEKAWYVVPMSSANPWPSVTPAVEPIAAEKIGERHYRFGMKYTNMPCRVVAANASGFLASLLLPILTVLVSEIVIQYDIYIDETGEVHAETLYTLGQVTHARWLGIVPGDPQNLIVDSMAVSAVHYLTVLTSNYEVTSASTGNTIEPPTASTPMEDNISIKVGNTKERAFDIGMGREYSLINESTDPWTTEAEGLNAINLLLGARLSDFLLIAWQAPLSAFIFAHLGYGLSESLRSRYASVEAMASNVTNEFHSSHWWYAVTFPEWNGLRVHQDPVYVAYTSLSLATSPTGTTSTPTEPGDLDGLRGLLLVGGVVAVIVIALVIKRR